MKPVKFSAHALSYTKRRGFTTGEVEMAIQTAAWESAEAGRMQCRKDFPFAAEWNGKFYAAKQVRPIFVEEATEIVIVTVYTYFF